MTPEEEAELELEAQARLELEQETSQMMSVAPEPAAAPPSERSWLESAYDGVKDYGVPATQLGIDVGTSLLKVGGPAGWAAQPVVSSALGWYPETAVRFAGETVDNIFGTKLEPKGGYRDIVNETSDNAIKNAATGFIAGGGLQAAGWALKGTGKVARSIFDAMPYKRKAILPPSAFSSTAAQESGDATIAALEKEGVFPPSLDRNPFLASQDSIKAIQEREGMTLAGLRNEIDGGMSPVNRSDILGLQNPVAEKRYMDYNRMSSPTADQEKTLFGQIEKEAIDEPMTLSNIADRKANYTAAAGNFPSDQYAGQVQQTFSKLMQMKEKEMATDYFTRTNQPEKLAQYMASLKLYGDAESAVQVGSNWAGSLATATKNGKGLGASFGDQSGLRFFTSLGGLTDEPAARTLYNKAFTPQSAAGRWMGDKGGQYMIEGGQSLMRGAGLMGSAQPEVSSMFSAEEAHGDSGPLLQNLTEPKAVAISRNLNQIDANAIEMLIPSFVESHNAQPLIFQFKRLIAEGDKSKIADFLGQFSNKYPDFPLQRGAVTGLPSEFDLGDGVARLVSPTDKAEYERRVNVSEMDVVEKAMRTKAVREQGIVHSFNTKLIPPQTRIDPTQRPSSSSYQFAPRQQTANGSRKFE